MSAATPAPGSLRSELEACVRIWREESQPYPGESAEDTARRGGFGYCADELQQVLDRYPGPQPAPGDVGYLGSDELAKRYGDALQRIADAGPLSRRRACPQRARPWPPDRPTRGTPPDARRGGCRDRS